jgi:hypothetical protein
MKKIITLFCIAAITLSSCTSSGNKTTAGTDTIINGDTLAKSKSTPVNNNTPTVYSLCFLRTEGKDSTSIEFVIHGDNVTGQMNWIPYQKDSRKGFLEGTIKNNIIKAKWAFIQEGMKDTLNLDFQFKDSQLSQKPLKLNNKTGRDQTDESAGYSLIYKSADKIHH